jgi:hypothetical protein
VFNSGLEDATIYCYKPFLFRFSQPRPLRPPLYWAHLYGTHHLSVLFRFPSTAHLIPSPNQVCETTPNSKIGRQFVVESIQSANWKHKATAPSAALSLDFEYQLFARGCAGAAHGRAARACAAAPGTQPGMPHLPDYPAPPPPAVGVLHHRGRPRRRERARAPHLQELQEAVRPGRKSPIILPPPHGPLWRSEIVSSLTATL